MTGWSVDSRSIAAGDVFFALRGPNHDGHAFVAEAFRKGARAAAMQSMEIPDTGIPDGNTEQERYYNEKEEEIHHAARIQAVIKAEAIENNIVEALGGKPSGSTKAGGRPIISTSE